MSDEFEITIYIDRDLEITVTKKVRKGRTVGFLKHMLSKETGTPRKEITVALLPPSGRILSDDEVIDSKMTMLEIRPSSEDPEESKASAAPRVEKARAALSEKEKPGLLPFVVPGGGSASTSAPAATPAPAAATPAPAAARPAPAAARPAPSAATPTPSAAPASATPAPAAPAAAPTILPPDSTPGNTVKNPEWEVIGGADKGGILVRTGQDLKSPPADDRLATGAIIEQLHLFGERLHFKLVSGAGPSEGWVSTRIGGKDLVQQLPDEVQKAAQEAKEEEEWKSWSLGRATTVEGKSDADTVRDTSGEAILAAKGRPYEVLGLAPGSSNATIKRAYHALALLHHPDKGGDPIVFKTIAGAYKALTEAKDDAGGWRDLEGQAVGPWPGHLDLSTKGVTAMLFDTFSCPPWDSRRLYTGGYLEGNIKCWELSKGEPGKVRPPPRLAGEISVGGFINDLAAISPYGLITAQSAGMKPLPGESLRCWNMRRTPFRAVKKITQAQLADAENRQGRQELSKAAAAKKGINPGPGADKGAIVEQKTDLVAADDEDDEDQKLLKAHADDNGYLMLSEMIYIHYRGVRVISLWPKPALRDDVPIYAATVSKDVLAVSSIDHDGCTFVKPPLWSTTNPHMMTDVNAMMHENISRIWTGDNGGLIKSWDVDEGRKECVSKIEGGASGWLSGLCLWPAWGALVCSHSSGLGMCDLRNSTVVRQQYTKEAVGKVVQASHTSPYMFAGVGRDLNMYDLRVWGNGDLNEKPKVVAQWTMPSNITGLACCETGKSHILVAAGCLEGQLAAFDTT